MTLNQDVSRLMLDEERRNGHHRFLLLCLASCVVMLISIALVGAFMTDVVKWSYWHIYKSLVDRTVHLRHVEIVRGRRPKGAPAIKDDILAVCVKNCVGIPDRLNDLHYILSAIPNEEAPNYHYLQAVTQWNDKDVVLIISIRMIDPAGSISPE